MRAFFDTNIFVYAFLDVEKRRPALAALARGGVISVQVLNEFTSVARRKWQRPWQEIEAAVGVIRVGFPEVVPVTVETHAAALTLARDHGLSFCDALIVASAQDAGCDTLYSEGLQAGLRLRDLAVVNPFEV